MPRHCRECGADWEEPLPAGDPCPECGEPLRSRRRDDDETEFSAPRRPNKSNVLLIALAVIGGTVLLGCGGCIGIVYLFSSHPVKVLDAGRQASPQGGTGSVSATIRIENSKMGAGNEYIMMAKAGDRTSVHHYRVFGPGGGAGDLNISFPTPELANQSGPVEFWVERDEHGKATRVSEVRKIP